MASLSMVFLGLSITSAWGNGHATTYRGLLRELASRGHRVSFFERAAPWYEQNADMPDPTFCSVQLYSSLPQLYLQLERLLNEADAVILGSYVPDGSSIAKRLHDRARGVTAFYDIDTPITLRALEADDCAYLSRADVPGFDLYLSFSGGSILTRLEQELGARRAAPLYCSVDTELYYPEPVPTRWDLGYLGTYSTDRQPVLDRLLLEPARRERGARFVVAGPQYPHDLVWPDNVQRLEHVAPDQHRAFYSSQRATLNVTRSDMVAAGYSPSVRLFEAAACGVPIVSDRWPGIESFFVPGEEILLAGTSEEVISHLWSLTPERRQQLAERARARVLSEHTAARRARQLEQLVLEVLEQRPLRSERENGRKIATGASR